MIESKIGQRLAGLLLMIAGVGFTLWEWQLVRTEGYFHRKIVVLFPFFAVLALGPLLFPFDMPEFRRIHGVHKPEKFSHLPTPWKLIFVWAIFAGLANWLAMERL